MALKSLNFLHFLLFEVLKGLKIRLAEMSLHIFREILAPGKSLGISNQISELLLMSHILKPDPHYHA